LRQESYWKHLSKTMKEHPVGGRPALSEAVRAYKSPCKRPAAAPIDTPEKSTPMAVETGGSSEQK